MSSTQEARKAIRARILQLLESGPVAQADLPAAVAVSPEERQEVARWNAEVQGVTDMLCEEGTITATTREERTTYHLTVAQRT
ncbi:hypothetical protein [Pontivivens insulae]|uniref:DUF3253 domain-containing protein n=1 Tax=Pontivivens insulae TaxID=1639689 RepID=A0A2R8AFM1_9RHOB|nr:hypothetical protein [Pontivivens insulae]RED12285.1 hypothetical protein DFR53_3003 [Pontivivens insulae]SPF31042.1 hypothetical protein POI8812_03392 [Pontivivens insulae]